MNKDIKFEITSDGEAFALHGNQRVAVKGSKFKIADEEITMVTLVQELEALRNELTTLKREQGLTTDPQQEIEAGEGVAPQTGAERYASTEFDPKSVNGGNNTTDSASEVASRTETEIGNIDS